MLYQRWSRHTPQGFACLTIENAAVMAMTAAFVSAGSPGYSLTMTRSRSSRGMEKVMVSARPSSSSGASAPSACRR